MPVMASLVKTPTQARGLLVKMSEMSRNTPKTVIFSVFQCFLETFPRGLLEDLVKTVKTCQNSGFSVPVVVPVVVPMVISVPDVWPWPIIWLLRALRASFWLLRALRAIIWIPRALRAIMTLMGYPI